MSIKWMLDVWERSPYEGSKLLIHLAMADSAHDDGVFFMSQALLAKRARCSVEQVRLTVRDMEKRELVSILRRGSSRGLATVYQLFPCFAAEKLPKSEGGVQGLVTESDSPNFDPNSPKLTPSLPKTDGSHPSFTSINTLTNGLPQVATTETAVELAVESGSAAESVARAWWEAQAVKPIGKNAWWSLLEVCKAAERGGYNATQIRSALDYIGTVPSMRQLDLILRGRGVAQPRETTAVKVAQQALAMADRLAKEGL